MKKYLLSAILGLFMLAGSVIAGAVSNLYMVQGDNWPYYYAQIVNHLNQPVDLTGTTVTADVVDAFTSNTVTSNAACVITDPVNAYVEYRWGNSETAISGTYWIYFKVVKNGSIICTVPSSSQARVIVIPIHR